MPLWKLPGWGFSNDASGPPAAAWPSPAHQPVATNAAAAAINRVEIADTFSDFLGSTATAKSLA
jgi:hypothetical protein